MPLAVTTPKRFAVVLAALLWLGLTDVEAQQRAAAQPAQNPTTPIAVAEDPRASCPPDPQGPDGAELEQLARTAQDRGFLWRVTKDGQASYLFGTLHAGRRSWILPGPKLRQAMYEVDALALELDPFDSATGKSLQKLIQGNKVQLPAALRTRLNALIRVSCAPLGSFDGMHPAMQTTVLGIAELRRDGLEIGYGQDLVLAALARRSGLPIFALETVQTQIQVMIPRQRNEVIKQVTRGVDDLESGTALKTLRLTVQAWESGDLPKLEAYESWCECIKTPSDRVAVRQLIADRNYGMAEKFDQLHQGGKRLLAAVGALHMAGPEGLPALLMHKGYRVERILFQDTSPQ